ncbi:hypothetical protein LWX53_02480 [bacterium]|nr:hypothetical protein [bacterium]
MKVRNIALALGAAALVLLLGSCDALFSNQFKSWGLGQVTNATINTAVTDGNVAAILAQSGLEQGGISQSFLNAATQDQKTADDVKKLLTDTKMSGGDDFIGNIVDAISTLDFNNVDFSKPETITNLFAALFPSRTAKTLPTGWSRADIALLINNVAGLGADINGLIATFQANNNEFLPAGVDTGWMAQVSAVVRILNAVAYNGTNYPSLGDALAALIDDGTTDPNSIVIGNYITNSGTILDTIKSDAGLKALLKAAGWDLDQLIS